MRYRPDDEQRERALDRFVNHHEAQGIVTVSATFELTLLNGEFVVCRLDASLPTPSWALEAVSFVSVTRTDDELSIICREQEAPRDLVHPPHWRALKVHGPFPFEAIGVMSTLSRSLANAKVPLLAISTHDTDYLFVRSHELSRGVRALRHDGHIVHTA
jgi:uncharacterized protein